MKDNRGKKSCSKATFVWSNLPSSLDSKPYIRAEAITQLHSVNWIWKDHLAGRKGPGLRVGKWTQRAAEGVGGARVTLVGLTGCARQPVLSPRSCSGGPGTLRTLGHKVAAVHRRSAQVGISRGPPCGLGPSLTAPKAAAYKQLLMPLRPISGQRGCAPCSGVTHCRDCSCSCLAASLTTRQQTAGTLKRQ